jgi:hypothetical protein
MTHFLCFTHGKVGVGGICRSGKDGFFGFSAAARGPTVRTAGIIGTIDTFGQLPTPVTSRIFATR